MNPFRESGLPRQREDIDGHTMRYGFGKGFVRAVYPQYHRVDIESELGGMVNQALVVGDILPEVHVNTTNPQHAIFGFFEGQIADPFCFLLPFRRQFGPTDSGEGDDKERHQYHTNQQIVRVKDITIRITPDNKIYLYESEKDDYAMYDMNERTFHLLTPHINLGTDDATRIEYDRDDQIRMVIDKWLMGHTANIDQDGITYLANTILHLVAPVIKLTASSEIVLDPPQIKLGTSGATEQLIFGNLFMSFYNIFVALFNSHVHAGVVNGGATSGAPTTPTAPMTGGLLSSLVHVS